MLGVGELKNLGLSIKESFKFLNTLPHSRDQKGMLLAWHSYQIDGAIIVFNTIEMVNKPAFRDRLTMGLLPYKSVLRNISSSRLLIASSYQYIAFPRCSTTFPTSIIFPYMKLSKAVLAILSLFVFKMTTFGASIIVSLLPSLLMSFINTFTRAIKPRMSLWYSFKRCTTNSAISSHHVIIIAQDTQYCPIQTS